MRLLAGFALTRMRVPRPEPEGILAPQLGPIAEVTRHAPAFR